MFHEFSTVLDNLKRHGERFDAETLKLLHYSDLHRATTGDAGDQECDLELVEAEQNTRLAPWLSKVGRHSLHLYRHEMEEERLCSKCQRFGL